MIRKLWQCCLVPVVRNMILLHKNNLVSKYFLIALFVLTGAGCNEPASKLRTAPDMVHIVTLDPGHFHAALVQKSMYPDVDSNVYVYAPEGNDLQYHLDRINGYNTRSDNSTRWNELVYKGSDFFEKMIAE